MSALVCFTRKRQTRGKQIDLDYCLIEKLQYFVKIMQDNNIRITSRGTWFISSTHNKNDFDQTIIAFEKTLKNLKEKE